MTNDTQTLTLTDFLLERVAEDEGRLPKYHDGMCEAMMRADRDPDAPCDCGLAETRRFIAADCEAKRLIVEQWMDHGFVGPGIDYLGERTLTLLAMPYADHSDYREEWRP